VRPASADDHEVLHHLLVDYLWKLGIVAALVVLCTIATVVIWKRAGREP
jgi:hypothetical protein